MQDCGHSALNVKSSKKYSNVCWNVTMFYRQELASLFQLWEKWKACRSSELNFPRSCLIEDDSHVKIVYLRVVVFIEHETLHFWDNFHLPKHYPLKVPQNGFNSFNYSNQTCIQVSKVSCALDKLKKTDLKFS